MLENNPVVDLTAQKYPEKQQNGQLSAAETEWTEASVDLMLRSLYSDDELRTLRRAGMDPAMGILVDGKPLEWFSDKEDIFTIKTDFAMKTEKRSFFTRLLEFLGIIPPIKSKIKEANDAEREYHKSFGATPEQLAEMPQDAAEMAQQSKRDEAAATMKINAVNDKEQTSQFELDFFGHLLPANTDENDGKSIVGKVFGELQKALSFTDQNGKERGPAL